MILFLMMVFFTMLGITIGLWGYVTYKDKAAAKKLAKAKKEAREIEEKIENEIDPTANMSSDELLVYKNEQQAEIDADQAERAAALEENRVETAADALLRKENEEKEALADHAMMVSDCEVDGNYSNGIWFGPPGDYAEGCYKAHDPGEGKFLIGYKGNDGKNYISYKSASEGRSNRNQNENALTREEKSKNWYIHKSGRGDKWIVISDRSDGVNNSWEYPGNNWEKLRWQTNGRGGQGAVSFKLYKHSTFDDYFIRCNCGGNKPCFIKTHGSGAVTCAKYDPAEGVPDISMQWDLFPR